VPAYALLHARHHRTQGGRQGLRESERYRTLVSQVKDYAIFRIDNTGLATSWNEGVRRVLGFDELEFIGQNIASRIFSRRLRRRAGTRNADGGGEGTAPVIAGCGARMEHGSVPPASPLP
jgi:PAS domain-containing protein